VKEDKKLQKRVALIVGERAGQREKRKCGPRARKNGREKVKGKGFAALSVKEQKKGGKTERATCRQQKEKLAPVRKKKAIGREKKKESVADGKKKGIRQRGEGPFA